MAKPKKNATPPKQSKAKKKSSEAIKTSRGNSQTKKSSTLKPSPKKNTAKTPAKKKDAGKPAATKAVSKKVPVVKKTPPPKKPASVPASAKKSAKEKVKTPSPSASKPVKQSPSDSGKKKQPTPPQSRAKSKDQVPAKTPAKQPAKGKSEGQGTVAPAKAKPAPEPVDVSTEKTAAPSAAKTNARDLLRSRILGNKKATKPIAFTLEEVREIAKTTATKNGEPKPDAPVVVKTPAKPDLEKLAKAVAPSHVKAASLADIFGFNPRKTQRTTHFEPVENIPEKYRRYYKLLIDLRTSLTEGLTLHTEETLRRSTKDDAGDLSSYGQHMADAGTDTFDRDFALSMVANEQEALTEIDAAIKRVQNGTYGICEITQKPISKERLQAVPFTRYSAEAQKDLERNRMRVRTAAGLFGEGGDDSGRADDGLGGDEE